MSSFHSASQARAAQGAAVEAWKEATSMRKMGREPSRVDLASFFAAADNADPADVTKAEALPGGPPHAGAAPGAAAPKPKKTARFAPGPLDDYTVKAGVLAPPRAPDYSVRAGGAARAAGAAATAPAAGGTDAMADRSVRFRANIADSPEAFAARFGPYQGRLADGEHAAADDDAAADEAHWRGPGAPHRAADPSVRFRDAVAAPGGGGYAAKFGAYSDDPRALIPGDSGHGPADVGSPLAAALAEPGAGEAAPGGTPGKPRPGLGRRAGGRASMDERPAPERHSMERAAAATEQSAPVPRGTAGSQAAAMAGAEASAPPAAEPGREGGLASTGPGAAHAAGLSGGFGLPQVLEDRRMSIDAEGRVKGARLVKSSLIAGPGGGAGEP